MKKLMKVLVLCIVLVPAVVLVGCFGSGAQAQTVTRRILRAENGTYLMTAASANNLAIAIKNERLADFGMGIDDITTEQLRMVAVATEVLSSGIDLTSILENITTEDILDILNPETELDLARLLLILAPVILDNLELTIRIGAIALLTRETLINNIISNLADEVRNTLMIVVTQDNILSFDVMPNFMTTILLPAMTYEFFQGAFTMGGEGNIVFTDTGTSIRLSMSGWTIRYEGRGNFAVTNRYILENPAPITLGIV